MQCYRSLISTYAEEVDEEKSASRVENALKGEIQWF